MISLYNITPPNFFSLKVPFSFLASLWKPSTPLSTIWKRAKICCKWWHRHLTSFHSSKRLENSIWCFWWMDLDWSHVYGFIKLICLWFHGFLPCRLIFPRRESDGGGGDVKGRLCRQYFLKTALNQKYFLQRLTTSNISLERPEIFP